MKTEIKLTFDNDDMYQDNAIRRTINATGAYLTIYGIDNHLRQLLKKDHSESVYEAIEAIRNELYKIMDGNGVSLDDLE